MTTDQSEPRMFDLLFNNGDCKVRLASEQAFIKNQEVITVIEHKAYLEMKKLVENYKFDFDVLRSDNIDVREELSLEKKKVELLVKMITYAREQFAMIAEGEGHVEATYMRLGKHSMNVMDKTLDQIKEMDKA